MTDPVLTEIETQLKLAQQALNNVAAFVARMNQDNTPNDSSTEHDTDGDEPFETYEDFEVAPHTHTGGRNGRTENVKRR